MLRKVKMYGELAEFVGHKELDAVVKNPAEAVRFLVTNFPKLEAYMANNYYQVLVGKEDVEQEDLHNPIGQEDIHFIPVITGAGGSTGRILLGAALIGASFLPQPCKEKEDKNRILFLSSGKIFVKPFNELDNIQLF